ncbi:MAG: molybdate ABC transporter substrate-binding protein [SAR202 cluster bacterium]|nr:molybdate ABC transporter substrate-binding protein [SAR202 cluster bacterium]
MPELSILLSPTRRVNIFLLSLLVLAIACGGGGSTTLKVMAASSLTQAFQDLARDFEAANPGVSVKLEFGGSQRLRSQLEFGAKADVFASADHQQMDLVVAAGLTDNLPLDFASNTLVVIAVPKSLVSELADLARPGVRLALAQASVPVGAYSRLALQNLANDDSIGLGSAFMDAALANLVSEEPNVRTVAQKVALGEVDAGIVYQTDVSVAEMAGAIRVIPIPQQANVNAQYPITVLQNASDTELAREFVSFVLSETGQRRLAEQGFGAP